MVLHLGESTEFEPVGAVIEGRTAKGMLDNVSESLMPAVGATFAKVDSLLSSLNTLVSDPAIASSVKRLDAITLALETTMKQLRASTAALPPVIDNVNGITGNLAGCRAMTSLSFQANSRRLPLILSWPISLISALISGSFPLRSTTPIRRSDSVTPHDSSLYNDLNNCAASLDSLLIDVKKNPKRYISIKLL